MTVSGIAGRVNGVSEEGEEHHEMSSWFDVNRTLGIDSGDKGGRLRETTAGRKTTAILENSLIIGSDFLLIYLLLSEPALIIRKSRGAV